MSEETGQKHITVPEAIRDLLAIVERLRTAHGNKKPFTLDGRLVGDIGEVLAAGAYEIELLEGLARHHDGKFGVDKFVQIKATMKDSLTFPGGHVPDFYLGIKIHPDGTFDEIFNGPGHVAALAVARRSTPKNNLHSIPLGALKRLQAEVPESERVPRRPTVE